MESGTMRVPVERVVREQERIAVVSAFATTNSATGTHPAATCTASDPTRLRFRRSSRS
jgi:hypothetical protein